MCKDSIQYWNYEWPRYRAQYYGFTFSLNRWSVSKDSILSIMRDKEKITRYTDDTPDVRSLLTLNRQRKSEKEHRKNFTFSAKFFYA